ncbi:hypothetical protein CbuG_1218 [Coxiella burnetii CbuG_Q212]|nr:hypothetical protein CbuG_1218 [Coxiella burnetii CbuG_Q212]
MVKKIILQEMPKSELAFRKTRLWVTKLGQAVMVQPMISELFGRPNAHLLSLRYFLQKIKRELFLLTPSLKESLAF